MEVHRSLKSIKLNLHAKMEGELEFERKHRREADGEIIKLRASLNGVDLKHEEIEALQMAQQLNPCF
jgi:hypothetical protein